VLVTPLTQRGCRHQVDKRSSHSRPKGGCRHQVDRRSSHGRPKGLPSPSRQKGDVVTKPTSGRDTVDRRGCRHQVGKKGMSSPSRQEVVTQSTEGVGTPSQPKERGHQVNPGVGTPSQPKERGHQVNPRAGTPSQPRSRDTKSTHGKRGGDTKSTHGEREGTPSQPTEKGRGHQVNPRKNRRAYQLIDCKRSIRRETPGS